MTKEEALLEIEIGLAARAEKLGCQPEFDRLRRRARRLRLDYPEFLAIARMMGPEDTVLRVRFEALSQRMRAKRDQWERRRMRAGSERAGYPAVVEPLAVAMRSGIDKGTDSLRDVMTARVDGLLRRDRRAVRITHDMLDLARQSSAERARIFSALADASPRDSNAGLHFGLALADAGQVVRARAEFRRLLKVGPGGTLRRLLRRLLRSCAPRPSRFASRIVTREHAIFHVELELAFRLAGAERIRALERLRHHARRSGYLLGEWRALACLKQFPEASVNDRRIAELGARLRSAPRPSGTFPYEVRSLLAAVDSRCGSDGVIMDARVKGMIAGAPRIADLARRISETPTCCTANVRAARYATTARKSPEHPEAWLRAGIAAEDAGHRSRACAAYSRGLTVARPGTDLHRLLLRLHRRGVSGA